MEILPWLQPTPQRILRRDEDQGHPRVSWVDDRGRKETHGKWESPKHLCEHSVQPSEYLPTTNSYKGPGFHQQSTGLALSSSKDNTDNIQLHKLLQGPEGGPWGWFRLRHFQHVDPAVQSLPLIPLRVPDEHLHVSAWQDVLSTLPALVHTRQKHLLPFAHLPHRLGCPLKQWQRKR